MAAVMLFHVGKCCVAT